ncbi:MAG: AbrB/MazE/SpoVT family DNA-binding domain-containing protein [Proteobacteria bacterium]|nr:AbrB/MazE/SpoVT family DNA-binding domain-containing protein [Pseudomonadota bacterium]
MSVVTATIKGQIVIPATIRKKYGIRKGSKVNIYEQNNRIVMEPIVNDPVAEGRGMLKTKGRVLRCLVKEREKEAKR